MAEASGPTVARLAYLTSQYPATSHTFISREVAALRDLGVPLDTFSIRPPSDSEMKDERLAEGARATFTVLRQKSSRFAAAHLAAIATKPGGYFRTLATAQRHRPPGLRGLLLSMAHFAEAIVLAQELKRRGIQRLHNHFANSGATVGYLAAGFLAIPWSFTMHGISETDYPAGIMLGRKIEAADFVACVSYFGRAQAMRLVEPRHWTKLHVVRCGLPLETLPARAASGTRKRLICVGRLSAEKGQAGLLEAFASLIEGHDDVELVLVGDGPERDLLANRANALGIAGKVRFAGRLSEQETIEEIARSDLLVLSSFMEGLPIVLMEAMAVGTPVIAPRVAGIPELVEDGKSGLLFTPSNWEELAACMKRLLGDDPFSGKLARAGLARVREEFDIRRTAESMRNLFTGIGTYGDV